MKRHLMKGIAAIAGLFVLPAVLIFAGQTRRASATVRDITYSADMTLVTLQGTVNSAIAEQTATITFKSNPLVRSLTAGTDVTSWFKGATTKRPAGIKATVAETAAAGSTSFKVKFTGTVLSASQDDIAMDVINYYFDETEHDPYATASVRLSDTHKYNFVRNFTYPSGYTGAGTAIMFKNQKSGQNGWKLEGRKGVAITSNNELDVVINGNFLTSINAGYDITSWFTGELYYFDTTNMVGYTSFLPDGVKAKIKNKISPGDNSFTVVFTGTPTVGSNDLLAFTIPRGYTSFFNGVEAMGDSQEALKVYFLSRLFTYNIVTDDESELLRECIQVKYPNVTLEAGVPVTEADNIVVEYETKGYVGDDRITFKDVRLTNPLGVTVRSLSYQEPGTGRYCDGVTNATGLTAKVFYVSDDGTVMRARLVGTPSAQSSYPYSLSSPGYTGFILHRSWSTAGRELHGYSFDENTITITEPTLHATVSGNVTVTKGEDENIATITGNPVTISLGTDTLAQDFSAGTILNVFHYENYSDPFYCNGIYVKVAQDAKKGDSSLKVNVCYTNSKLMFTEKGYLRLEFPKEYITRLAAFGKQSHYSLPDRWLYEDIKKKEVQIKIIWPTDAVIGGTVNVTEVTEKYLHEYTTTGPDGELIEVSEWDTRTTDLDIKPIGKGIVYFDLEIYSDKIMKRSYEAGESVRDTIDLTFFSDNDRSPFCPSNWQKQFPSVKDLVCYDICTVDQIEAECDETPRVLHLMIDLSKTYALKPCTEMAVLSVKTGKDDKPTATLIRYSDSNPNFRFDIRSKNTPGGESGEPAGKPDIWVNGKDNKKTETYNKSMTKALSDLGISLPDDCKWVVSVTGTDVTEAANALSSGKGKKSNIAKASYKAKDGNIVVGSGKTPGVVRVWLIAVNKKKAAEESAYFDVTVGTAPKKIYVTKDDAGEAGDAVKTVALSVGESVVFFANANGTALSSYTSFTWEALKDKDCLQITALEDTRCAEIRVISAPEGGKVLNASIQVTNVQSGKKVKIKVPITNSVVSVTGLANEKTLGSAAEEAVEEDLGYSFVCSDGSAVTTDKIKVYVTSATEEGEGYTLSNNKFKLSGKSSSVSVKYNKNDGSFKLKAKKKTAAGTQVRVLIVATHADKTIEVFESGVITIG